MITYVDNYIPFSAAEEPEETEETEETEDQAVPKGKDLH